jgi:hypothetical protein
MNKAMIESYLRNLLGQAIGAVTIVMQTSGIANPANFTQHEWLLVANALWASLVPVAMRFIKKSDPAFGLVANLVVKEVDSKMKAAVKKAPAKKAPAKKK